MQPARQNKTVGFCSCKIEVSSQDKSKSTQHCICKAELIISWQGKSSLFKGPEILNVCKTQRIREVARASSSAGTGRFHKDIQDCNLTG